MLSTKNIIRAGSGLMVLLILINAVIIKIAGTFNDKLFFCLLSTLTFLALTVYFIRRKKQVAILHYHLFNKEGHSQLSQIKGPSHFINRIKIQENELKVLVGTSRCSQPYHVSILNTATINNNDLSKFFISSVTRKPELFNLDKYIDGDDISTYCLNGEDLVWQIGPAYLGCRSTCGNFNTNLFKKNALNPGIKMIELKFSDFFSTDNYGILSGDAITGIRNDLSPHTDITASEHTAFKCAEAMMIFVGTLQKLSSGKPIGIRLFINDKKKFYEICYAMRKTKINPDYIVIEGSVEGINTNTDNNGMPLYEALQFVSKTLKHYGLGKEIKIIATGKIVSGFDLIKLIALGADSVCTFMPDYTIANRESRYIDEFRKLTIETMIEIMENCGFKNLHDITLEKLFRGLDMLPLIAVDKSHKHNSDMNPVKIMNRQDEKYKRNSIRKRVAIL